MNPLRVGLIVNPVAGIGGPAALKGSDGVEIQSLARRRGSVSHVAERVHRCLACLHEARDHINLVVAPGPMGADYCEGIGLSVSVVGTVELPTDGNDTRRLAAEFEADGVDVLLFAGGDGTARDILDGVSEEQVVLGVPCGVKMHSGVFAISPDAAGRVLQNLAAGHPVTALRAEVRDIDEEALRRGELRARYCGELTVPAELRYLQHTKEGGREVEALVLEEIAADVVENILPGVTYFIGAGSTTRSIKTALGIQSTLLGVDVVCDGKLQLADATERDLRQISVEGACRIVVSPTGGQGFLFGRGNQQFSPEVLRRVGVGNVIVVGAKTKLKGLSGRPLLVDTGDVQLDAELSGVVRVVTGYEDAVLMRVAAGMI